MQQVSSPVFNQNGRSQKKKWGWIHRGGEEEEEEAEAKVEVEVEEEEDLQ